jgi:hypothetical protein
MQIKGALMGIINITATSAPSLIACWLEIQS